MSKKKILSLKKKKTKLVTGNLHDDIRNLFDPEDAKDLRDKFINDIMSDANKIRRKAINGDLKDSSAITETYLMTSEYIPTEVLDVIPTNDIAFNLMCSMDIEGKFGIPRGKMIELSGPAENMKSARAASIVAAAQQDPRGAIVVWYETESKINRRYIEAAGCDISAMIVKLPDYIEQVYKDMMDILHKYLKDRNKAIKERMKKLQRKNISADEFEYLHYVARMSYPIIVFVYDSIGNHAAKEAYDKAQAGKEGLTIGKHAKAHADGYRNITVPLGNASGVLININHTKDLVGGGGGRFGVKSTTTYGGTSVKFMNSLRIEQTKGVGGGGSSLLSQTVRGEKVITGRWLTAKILKNSLLSTSQAKLENILFRYDVGFDMGISYFKALQKCGNVVGNIGLTSTAKTRVKLPGHDDAIELTFRQMHDMVSSDASLKKRLDKYIYKTMSEHYMKFKVG